MPNKKQESNIRDLWDNIKHATFHVTEVPEEGGEIKKCIWINYDWKFAKSKEGSRYPGKGSTEGPRQDELKQIHTKSYHI